MLRGDVVGFSGTQNGMTKQQKAKVRKMLLDGEAVGFHHGDCVGADVQAAEFAHAAGLPITIHPPDNESKRAFSPHYAEMRDPKPYLVRNRDIAQEATALIATPKETGEVVRSGTWSTIRYAVKQRKPVYIVWPSGMVEEYWDYRARIF